MEPATKSELLDRITAERARLDALLEPLSGEQLARPGVEGDLSIKDLMAHIAWWERRMLTVLEFAARGERAPSLAREDEGDTWLDRVNAEVFARSQGRSLDEVRAEYRQSFEETIAAIQGYSEAELFDPEGLGRTIGHPALDVIAGNTYGHYEEHISSIRAWLDAHKQ